MTKTSESAHDWWSRLRHQGLLLSPAVMVDRFPAPEPVAWWPLEKLREARNRFLTITGGEDSSKYQITTAAVSSFVDTLFEVFLGHSPAHILKQGQFDESLSTVFRIGSKKEIIRPHRVIAANNSDKEILLFIMADTSPHVGRGRGRTNYARFLELLRGTGNRLGIITNGQQVRLVYAGLDTESWCEWEVERWFDKGDGEEELAGFRQLLTLDTLKPLEPTPEEIDKKAKRPLSLLEAIEESRKRQADLSSVLGEAVRRAVEHLTDELSAKARSNPDLLEPIYLATEGRRLEDVEVHDALLQATVRIVMRMVVCLFAESRGLLPVNDPIYAESYGVRSLFELLEKEVRQEGGEFRLFEYRSAWPRLMALFRLVYEGSFHGNFPLPKYGGLLFRPGQLEVVDNDGNSTRERDAVLRALYVLEHDVPVSDGTIYRVLRKLLRGKLLVIQGRRKQYVPGPVDYTLLRTEFIGIIYEGLLDYKLKRVVDSPQVFLNIGVEPVLPLERLEGMLLSDKKGLKDLLTKLKKEKTTKKSDEEAEDESEAVVLDEEQESGEEPDIFSIENEEAVHDDAETEDDDSSGIFSTEHLDADQRAWIWAKEAVKLAGLAPKKRKRESEYAYEKRTEAVANGLIKRVVGEGEFFLVRSGNVRKGTGTFYTKPQLAVPTVHRTLEPLCYSVTDSSEKIPKTPEEILDIKVCDPACGSASFLVAALHYLSDALYASLRYCKDIENPEQAERITLPYGEVRTGTDDEELVPFPPNDPHRGHQFEDRVKAMLRRHVVERCIYGVDINPLAVEFARVSLWVETMDPTLPFSFLDHKIKVGNSMVGCWLDRVLDYPIAAWLREGGDGKDGERTDRIETFLKGKRDGGRRKGDGIIKQEMRAVIESRFGIVIPLFPDKEVEPSTVVNEAGDKYERLHSIRLYDEEAREAHYREVQDNPVLKRLKQAMDEWCAVWFWPMDETSSKLAPTPMTFHADSADRQAIIDQLVEELKFFHWELEFPDVFTPKRQGFDAVIGNPPWDKIKPISQEFFTEFDPIYRTYDKQSALRRQRELFQMDPNIKVRWDEYNSQFKAMSNWVSNVAQSFEVRLARGKKGDIYQSSWQEVQHGRNGYATPHHPFIYQGSADLNSYKMFLEVAYTLLMPAGRLGLIVPSGLYTDAGSVNLRSLFLDECTWDWLFSFENRKKIFDIHGSFKFASVIVDRRRSDKPLKAAFMIHDVALWEQHLPPAFEFNRAMISLFSPRSKSIPELQSLQDLEISRKIYDHSFRIGDKKPGWEINYATEFHMTNDSMLFPPLEKWKVRGYQPDVFGRWIGPDGDVALPLYEGRMINQFDFAEKGWVRGKGRSAEWRPISYNEKAIESQFLMSYKNQSTHTSYIDGPKLAIMDVTSATNERTTITSVMNGFSCGHTIGVLVLNPCKLYSTLTFSTCANSFTFDYTLRARHGGLHASWFILEECPLPTALVHCHHTSSEQSRLIHDAARLTFIHRRFAPEWLKLKACYPELEQQEWKQWWAVTEADRLRLRVEIDALCTDLYGLEPDDFDWIVRDDPSDPKGFWRVDKKLPYEERLTGLAARAFRALKEGRWSAETAGDLSNDEFFEMLGIPKLTNAEAARAKGYDRPLIYKRDGCHEWRPELFKEDDFRYGWTWEHCWQDAVALLGSEEAVKKYIEKEPSKKSPTHSQTGGKVDLFGNPLPTDLFGDEIKPSRKKRSS